MPAAIHALTFLVLGAAVGFLGGLFGFGGALAAIPILALFFGLDQQHAQGTSLVIGAPNTVLGLWHYARRPGFDRRAAWLLACVGAPLTFVGAYVAVHVAGRGLRPGFGVFLALLAVWFAVRSLLGVSSAPRAPSRARTLLVAAFGALGGALSGLFAGGGTAVAVPLLATFGGYAQTAAQGLGFAIVTPGSVVSIATYAWAGDIDWAIGIPLALGGTFTLRYGVALAHRVPERTLRLLFCLLLFASAAALVRGRS